MFVQEVVEVLYSPVKAFKKIVKKPDFKAVILVFVLVAAVGMVSQYVASSKLYIENRMPEDDDWTEALGGEHGWVSSGSVSLDDADYKMGSVDANHSVSSSAVNASSVWMKLLDIGSVNCSGEGGYIELFFWIKWTSEGGVAPTSGSVKLFSGGEDSYFESDITDLLGSSGEWTNATFSVGQGQGWTSTNSSSWQNIVGLEFGLDWESPSNSTVKVDGIYFRKYASLLESGEFTLYIPSFLLQVVFNFAINWVLWAGILILVAKLFNEDFGRWNVFFVIIGYSFIVTVVYTLINVVLLSTLPPLDVPLDPVALNALLDVTWRPLLAYQLWLYVPVIGEVWITALGAVAIRALKTEGEVEFPWSKAATIAVVAFAVRFLLRLFLGF